MHRRESTTRGSTMALVGHASIQRVHVPQKSGMGESGGNSRVVRIVPRKNHEPRSRAAPGCSSRASRALPAPPRVSRAQGRCQCSSRSPRSRPETRCEPPVPAEVFVTRGGNRSPSITRYPARVRCLRGRGAFNYAQQRSLTECREASIARPGGWLSLRAIQCISSWNPRASHWPRKSSGSAGSAAATAHASKPNCAARDLTEALWR